MKPRVRGVVAAAVAVAVATTGVWFFGFRDTGLPDGVVLRVGAHEVTAAQLDQRVQVLSAVYGVQRPTDAAQARDFDRAAAQSMAISLILEDDATARDIVIPDKAASDQLDALINDQLTGGRQAFVDFLAQAGISEGDVLGEIKQRLATPRIVEQVTKDVPAVTDSQVTDFYAQHRAEFVSAESRHLRNIVVATEDEARRVLQLARTGSDLASLAARYSRDGSTRDSGGDLGTLTADQLESGYAQAAFAAAAGGLYGPVKSQYGWNVGQVVEVNASYPVALDDVRTELQAQLLNKARLDVWRQYLSDLIAKADVTYADAYRPADPLALPEDVASEPPARLGGTGTTP